MKQERFEEIKKMVDGFCGDIPGMMGLVSAELLAEVERLRQRQDLQQLATEFCARFDVWIMRQSEPTLTKTAWAFGIEYARLRDKLVELNGAAVEGKDDDNSTN